MGDESVLIDEAAFDALSEDEQHELMTREVCGSSLGELLEAAPEDADLRELMGTLVMLKVGTAAREAFEEGVLIDGTDAAEFALILVEIVVQAALGSGAHKHKLASGLRGVARDL